MAEVSMYPVRFSVDYQTEERSRGLALAGALFFVKAILVIPHWIALAFVGIAALFVIAASYLVIIVTGTIPDWGVRWVLGLTNWGYRVAAWLCGMRDEYPPFGFDSPYPARVEANLGGPERGRGLATAGIIVPVKMLLALPHLIIVGALSNIVAPIAWVGFLIVLFTGTFPTGLHRFFHGFLSWSAKVAAWIGSVVDEYPPFEWDDGGEPATG